MDNTVDFFGPAWDELASEFPQDTIEYAHMIEDGAEDIFLYIQSNDTLQ